ncbi:MAG: hypothetical protein K0Q57_87 [Gammaproteobacteria bacterium]|jgi:hypothetical protein|nr:hypothetical protein [Gammaproteobacteria bacterium]
MIDDKKQNILYGFIILAVSVIFYIISPSISEDPHGILLPSGAKTYAVTDPSSVQLYETMPKRAIVLGTVRATKHFDSITEAADISNQNTSVQFAQKLAAQAGANGLVITTLGRTYETGPLDGFVLYGKAIRTY